MDRVLEKQIRLMSVEPLKVGNLTLDSSKVVKLTVFDEHSDNVFKTDEMLTVSLVYPSDKYKDEELVRVAKADFHGLCQSLVEVTKAWALTDEQRAQCERQKEDLPF